MSTTPRRRSTDNAERYDVVGFGTIVVDQLAIVPRYPAPDEKMGADSILLQPGGPVPTALALLSRMGRSTAFCGLVGDDYWGDWLSQILQQRKIDAQRLVRVPSARTPLAQICSEHSSGTRTVLHDEGMLPALELRHFALADQQGSISQRASDILDSLPAARCIHVDGREHEITPRILEEYRRRESLVCIDCGTFRRRTLELLPLADCIIMPAGFAHSVFGNRPLERLVADCHDAWLSASRIVITDGIRGSAGWSDGEIVLQRAWPVTTLDSCGAGDIHTGAFIHATLEGMSLAASLAFSAAAAALKCTVQGNGSSPESAAAVFHFLDTQAAD